MEWSTPVLDTFLHPHLTLIEIKSGSPYGVHRALGVHSRLTSPERECFRLETRPLHGLISLAHVDMQSSCTVHLINETTDENDR